MNNKNTFIEKEGIVKGLYGSEFSCEKACAYCRRHGCYLTPKTTKQHECLNKQCEHFVKNESHIWWEQRAMIKAKRKARKSNIGEV